MIELSEKPASATPSEGSAAAPDWALVPFEVGCARCGHDLRGLSDPKCPACGLEFEWSKAVPLEELTCPACNYHLIGLSETRCPECGRPFTWEGVLVAAYRRHVPLFEYHWRDHPFTSFLATWWRTMRPRRFWCGMGIHERPQALPLVGTVVVTVAGLTLSVLLINALGLWLQRRFWLRGSYSSQLLECLQLAASRESRGGLVLLSIAWIATCLGALYVFNWSMRRINVRRVQVLRVWAYAVSTPLMVFVVLAWVSLALQYMVPNVGPGGWLLVHPRNFPVAAVIMVGLTTRSLWQGYKQYLRMPHAAAVAVASQIIAILAALIIWDAAFGGKSAYLISYFVSLLLGRR